MEENKNETVELTELFAEKEKSFTLSDIIVVQSIVCMAVSVVFVLLNMLLPKAAEGIYDELSYWSQADISFEELMSAIIRFVNSSPSEGLRR